MKVKQFFQMKKPSCYEARLKIQRVELSDARIFRLVVENEKGSDVVDVTLKVTGNILFGFDIIKIFCVKLKLSETYMRQNNALHLYFLSINFF